MATKKQAAKTETTQQNSNSENGNSQDNSMVFLGGMWANRDKNGEIYFSGYLGSAKIFLFKNKKKTDPKQPDYWMQVANQQKRSDEEINLEDEIGDDIPF